MPYLPPNLPDLNHLRHMLLLGWRGEDDITRADFDYSVAHYNEKGEPDDWFYDSFLVLGCNAPSGNYLLNDINLGTSMSGEGDFYAVPASNPGTKRDWGETIEGMFAPGGFVPGLNQSIVEHKARLGDPPHKRNFVMMIPYPHPNQTFFHREHFKQPWENFSVVGQNLMQATQQRLNACKWFVDETIARWEKEKPSDLSLLGFYWLYESLHYSWDVDDHWLLKELYKHIRARGYRFFWIPFYSSFNVHLLSDYRGFYFDGAFLQPNYMFYQNITGVGKAAEEARARNAGIEMEYYLALQEDTRVGREKHKRLRDYLNGGIDHGYMTESACAYFMGFRDLARMATHENPIEREFYHDLYHFARGDYAKK